MVYCAASQSTVSPPGLSHWPESPQPAGICYIESYLMNIGIDFGTTNSALATATPPATTRLASYATSEERTETFRSLLYFERDPTAATRKIKVFAGPSGIDQYLRAEHKGRLIQSVKSYLASRLFTSTNIFGRHYSVEELVSLIIRGIKTEAEGQLGDLGEAATVGRPVNFVSAETAADEELAISRLTSALKLAGINEATFEYEPVAAAYFYEAQLTTDQLILIADFGGGTSDFSILRVGPTRRTAAAQEGAILANGGVPLAGDSFDARIVRHVVSPQLGKDTMYKSMGRWLEVPSWIYIKLERWHHLSFLRTKETMDVLKSIRATAMSPERIDALISLIDEDLGYELHQAVQSTKYQLSHHEEASFEFRHGGIAIKKKVKRTDFEKWIRHDLNSIADTVDRLLQQAGITAGVIEQVFLTGGSSLVPAVRRLFAERFGAERLTGGGEFTSIARGLALRSLELRPR